MTQFDWQHKMLAKTSELFLTMCTQCLQLGPQFEILMCTWAMLRLSKLASVHDLTNQTIFVSSFQQRGSQCHSGVDFLLQNTVFNLLHRESKVVEKDICITTWWSHGFARLSAGYLKLSALVNLLWWRCPVSIAPPNWWNQRNQNCRCRSWGVKFHESPFPMPNLWLNGADNLYKDPMCVSARPWYCSHSRIAIAANEFIDRLHFDRSLPSHHSISSWMLIIIS